MKNYTMDEVAARYRLSIDTLRFWRQTGKGPKSWKPGRRVLYTEDALQEWEQAERAKSA